MSGRVRISLSALAANYERLCREAHGQVGAVVKADAYGLGVEYVAPKLRSLGCSTFFVATSAEGEALRHVLPDARIYVFEGVNPQSCEAMVGASLTPVLNTPTQVSVWSSTGRPAALHIDTGMQRLGFSYSDQQDKGVPDTSLSVDLMISHFARADEPHHPSVAEQLRRAQAAYAVVKKKHPKAQLSICNSAGLLQNRGPEDIGRAGIALYGGNPVDDLPNPMANVATLEARVIQKRHVPAGVPVGYGGTFVTSRPTKLAVVGVGYADGYPRGLSNTAQVYVAGQRCAVVGRVSMDLTVVDVSTVDVAEGDWVEMIGPHVPVDEIATAMKTISYEILTGLGKRLVRVTH